MADIDARLDLASRRNEARTLTIRVVGADWSNLAWRQQVRLCGNTPGAPILDIAQVANANAEGLYVVGVTIENGLPVTTVQLRYNMTTMRDQIPYTGELGDDARFSHAIQVGGVTRLAGDWWALASPIDSDAAPLVAASVYGSCGRARGVASSISLAVVADQIVSLVIDGSEQIASSLAAAKAARDAATDAAIRSAADRAQVAIDRAATDADVATTGAYRSAVLQAVGAIPANAVLAIQAATITALAALPSANRSQGDQAQVTQKNQSGVFEWTAGDQRALLAGAPAGQSMYVAPGSDPSGKSGLWRRVHDGIVLASWSGVLASGLSQTGGVANQVRLNWLFALADVWWVRLLIGTTGISGSVRPPAGKWFDGLNRFGSILRAVDYQFTGNGGDAYLASHFMVTVTGGSGSRFTDMTIDGAKTGAKRINQPADNNSRLNGVNGNNCTGFIGERLFVTNITGYGLLFTSATDSRFSYCATANVQVHCEATNGSLRCLYDTITATDGDGDIACESPFHALNASQQITFRDSTYNGDAASGLLVVGNEPSGIPTTGIHYENVSVTLTGATTCVTVTNNFPASPCDVTITGGKLTSKGGAYGLSNCRVHVRDTHVEANDTGVSGSGFKLRLTKTTLALGATLGAGSYAAFWNFTDRTSEVTIDGGRLIGKANGENTLSPPFNGAVRVIAQPDTRECPTGEMTLLGAGHRVMRVLANDDTGIEFYVGAGAGKGLGFQTVPGAVYRVTISGTASCKTAGGFAITAQGNSTACTLYGGEGFIQAAPADRTSTRALIDTFDFGLVVGNSMIANASADGQPQQFGAQYMVRAAPNDSSVIRTTAYTKGGDGYGNYAANNFAAGPVTVGAGTTLIVEQIA